MDINEIIYKIATWGIPVLFAITFHEVAHGYIASRLGDNTARMEGRLTLNPAKHIDPIGTILVPLVLLLLPGGFLFGWAKPVPVVAGNLGNPRRDMAYVAIAGPIANLLMAIFWAICMRISHDYIGAPAIREGFIAMSQAGIIINLILMLFNLFPIPPLDGGRVLSSLLPTRQSLMLDKIEPYGLLIIIGLIVLGFFDTVLLPLLSYMVRLIMHLVM